MGRAKAAPKSQNETDDRRGIADAPPRPNVEADEEGTAYRLRLVRESHAISQRELARRAGLTHGTIALIERGKISPSVGTLRKILNALSTSLAEFFAINVPQDQQPFFTLADMVEVGGKGVSLKQVGRNLQGRALQVLLEHYEPGAETASAPYRHEGEEGGVIIAGQIELTVGEETRILGPNDSYLFFSHLPHRFRNVGDSEAIIVSACSPPS